MRKINTETIALTGVTAAVYMVATLAISPIAYGSVQFRLSEVMVLLAWVNPSFIPGLVPGENALGASRRGSPILTVNVVLYAWHSAVPLLPIKRT